MRPWWSRFFVFMVASGSISAAGAQIVELALPTQKAAPSAIVATANGEVWFLETYANQVGRVSAAGAVSELPLPGSGDYPGWYCGLAVGPDGNLWMTAQTGSTIARMTSAGTLTEFGLGGGLRGPKSITSGPGGLWFTDEINNTVGRITTAGVVTDFALPGGFAGLSGITAGPDGNVWFTETARNKIGRITPTGTVTEFAVPTSSSGLAQITAGPDGNLWFTEAQAHKIGRITPAGVVTEFALGSGAQPIGITAAPDGNLWFTQNGNSMIGRITLQGSVTTFPLPTADSRPIGITADSSGRIWYTAAKANKIGRYGGGGTNPGVCTPSATNLCLAGDRFEVSVSWSTPAGSSGAGQAVELTADTGYFWFFDSANVELVVKLLDGRSLSGAWWVFYGALSNVRYTLRVRDTVTGAVKEYQNPQDNLASVADTRAVLDTPSFGAISFDTGAVATDEELQALAALDDTYLPLSVLGEAEAEGRQGAAGAVPVPGTSINDTPHGSTYEIEALVMGDTNNDGTFESYRICNPTGDYQVTFDGVEESLPTYGCVSATAPRVAESFTDNLNGTATVEIRMRANDGGDLFPGNLFFYGVRLTAASLRIGFFNGSDPLDWSPPHVVRAATLDLRRDGATVLTGNQATLDPALFFGAPNAWDGHFGIYYPNRAGTGIDEVILRLTVDHPTPNSGSCTPDATHLCLNGDRFRVSVDWLTPQGAAGAGTGVELTADTGYFWFFSAANVELVLKIIDGRPLSGHWWVFYGALSSVQYTITVADTTTGQSKTYTNPQGNLGSVADTRALP